MILLLCNKWSYLGSWSNASQSWIIWTITRCYAGNMSAVSTCRMKGILFVLKINQSWIDLLNTCKCNVPTSISNNRKDFAFFINVDAVVEQIWKKIKKITHHQLSTYKLHNVATWNRWLLKAKIMTFTTLKLNKLNATFLHVHFVRLPSLAYKSTVTVFSTGKKILVLQTPNF